MYLQTTCICIYINIAIDLYLQIAFSGRRTSINPSYFDILPGVQGFDQFPYTDAMIFGFLGGPLLDPGVIPPEGMICTVWEAAVREAGSYICKTVPYGYLT